MYGMEEALQMPMSDLKIRKLEPREKPYMVRDDRGLYLEILPNGAKYWRIRLWEHGKEIKRSLGVYPEVTLAQARTKRDEIRGRVSAGESAFTAREDGATFRAVTNEWLEKKVLPIRTPGHVRSIRYRVHRWLLPSIGHRPMAAITARDLLDIARRIEANGTYETAHRVMQICGQVFRYGVATGRCQRDPTGDLKGALVPVRETHHPTITEPRKIGALARVLDGYDGSLVVRCALRLALLTFVRPGELRNAEWREIDMAKAEWRIPAEKMKMRRPHVVPLSRQALAALEAVRQLTGRGRYVFPSIRTWDRPMSENTVNAALRRMGYEKDELTGHGFRSMASTVLNEHGWPADAIERQLAHVEGNSVRAAYNYAEHLEKRREMMQWWADWLEARKRLQP